MKNSLQGSSDTFEWFLYRMQTQILTSPKYFEKMLLYFWNFTLLRHYPTRFPDKVLKWRVQSRYQQQEKIGAGSKTFPCAFRKLVGYLGPKVVILYIYILYMCETSRKFYQPRPSGLWNCCIYVRELIYNTHTHTYLYQYKKKTYIAIRTLTMKIYVYTYARLFISRLISSDRLINLHELIAWKNPPTKLTLSYIRTDILVHDVMKERSRRQERYSLCLIWHLQLFQSSLPMLGYFILPWIKSMKITQSTQISRHFLPAHYNFFQIASLGVVDVLQCALI